MALELEEGARFRKFDSVWLSWLQRLQLMAIPVFSMIAGFDVPARLGFPMLQEQFLGLILMLLLSSVFMGMPATPKSPQRSVPWYDGLLCLASVLVGGYLVVYYPVIVNDIGEITPDKVILGWIALALVMESCRRMTGWVLLIIAAVFVLYAHYSDFFPGMLNARSESWSKIAVHLYIAGGGLALYTARCTRFEEVFTASFTSTLKT